MKTVFAFVIALGFIFTASPSKAQDTRYYDLVFDSLSISSLAKDTTIEVWISVDLWMDDTRRIYYKNIVRLGRKPTTVRINDRMYDVPRTQALSCQILMGPSSDFDISKFNYPYFSHAATLHATSKGDQIVFLDKKTSRGESLFLGGSPVIYVYWHLEVSKL